MILAARGNHEQARLGYAAAIRRSSERQRREFRVDRAAFPSDTLSSHQVQAQVQVPGGAALHRWGLLDRVIAAGTPPTPRIRFDYGDGVVAGRFPGVDGIDALCSPRRSIVDKILVDAALTPVSKFARGLPVEEIAVTDGRVSGVRGEDVAGGSARPR
jgi:hypothetical protein